MEVVELSTKLTTSGDVVIPRVYIKNIPAGSDVRVLILWEEVTPSQPPEPTADDDSLNALIARIKGRPLTPASTPSFSDIHAEDWMNPNPEQIAKFDPEQWNRAWDEIERTMETEEDADQEKTVA